MPSAWDQAKQEYVANGFSDDDIFQEEQRQRKDMFMNGFAGQEIDQYFGTPKFDPTELKDQVLRNVADSRPKAQDNSSSQVFEPKAAFVDPYVKKADSFVEALEAGFQQSVVGLLARGKVPDLKVSEDSGMFYNIASQVGSLAGDIPAMMAGGVAGEAAGPVGGAAAAFALPAAARKALMDYYSEGGHFKDFWSTLSASLIEGLKGGAVGAATAGVGGLVGEYGAKAFGGLTGEALARASEAATMVTVGKALEGKVPTPQDFLEGGLVVFGMHAAGAGASKLRKIYSDTGVGPGDVKAVADNNPDVKQQLLAENTNHDVINEALTGEKAPEKAATEEPTAKKTEGTKTEEPSLSDAETKILSKVRNIGEDVSKSDESSPLKTRVSEGFDEFYRRTVDAFDPVKIITGAQEEALGAPVSVDKNAYTLFRTANDAPARVKYAFERATVDPLTGADNGKGLKEIITPFKDEWPQLKAFLVASKAVELEGRGISSGFDMDAAHQVVKDGKARYSEVQKEIVGWENRNLEYLTKSGRLDPDLAEAFKKMNQNYIPFKRILDPKEGIEAQGGAGFLKKIGNATSDIKDPLQSMLENAQVLFQMADKNRAKLALTDALLDTNGEFGRKVEGQKGPLQDNQWTVYRNGNGEVWEADPPLAAAVKSLDGDIPSQNILVKVMSGFTQALKIGTTFAPDFALRHFFRNQLMAPVYGETGAFRPWESLVAIKDIVGKSDDYYRWLKSGGAGGAFLDLSNKYLTRDFIDTREETGMMNAVWNKVADAKEYAHALGTLLDQATRLAEFKRVSQGAAEGSKLFEAGMAARDVTIDYQRMGASISQLNAIAAFQNVAIQGLDKTLRVVGEASSDAVQKLRDVSEGYRMGDTFTEALQRGDWGVAGKIAPGVGLIMTASLLNFWNSHQIGPDGKLKDADWYAEINRWEKDLFWHIKAGNTVFRIPKPQELGIMFGTMVERTLEGFFTDNPHAFKDFGGTLGQMVVPHLLPDALTPPLEQYANKVFFTGNPIVNQASEKLLPAYQFTDYTSDTAKTVGKMVGMLPRSVQDYPGISGLASPEVFENYVRGWSGNLGMYVLKTLDGGLHAANKLSGGTVGVPDMKPSWDLADVPFIKSFVSRYPAANSQSIRDFQDTYKETEEKWNTISVLKRKGQATDVEWVVNQYKDDMYRLKSFQDKLNEMRYGIQLTYLNDKMSADDKRQLIDKMYFDMILTAKAGNLAAQQLQNQLKKVQ